MASRLTREPNFRHKEAQKAQKTTENPLRLCFFAAKRV
jgi:hypothetical protein